MKVLAVTEKGRTGSCEEWKETHGAWAPCRRRETSWEKVRRREDRQRIDDHNTQTVYIVQGIFAMYVSLSINTPFQ